MSLFSRLVTTITILTVFSIFLLSCGKEDFTQLEPELRTGSAKSRNAMAINTIANQLPCFDIVDGVYPSRDKSVLWYKYTDVIRNQVDLTTFSEKNWTPGGDYQPIDSGSNTVQLANHLVDAGATFVDDGIEENMTVRNTATNVQALVTAVTQTDLTLSADIFLAGGAGETYEIITFLLNNGAIYNHTNNNVELPGSGNANYVDVLNLDRYYSVTVTVSTYISGTLRVVLGLQEIGQITANGTYTFYGAPSTTTQLSLDGTTLFAQMTIDDVELKLMSTPGLQLRKCDTDVVAWSDYDNSDGFITYLNGTEAKAQIDIDITTTGVTAGRYYLCLTDGSETVDRIWNGDFESGSTPSDSGRFWTIANATTPGWLYTGNNAVHNSGGGGDDVISQELWEPLNAALEYELTFNFTTGVAPTMEVRYDTATLTNQLLETITSPGGAKSVDINNIAITDLHFRCTNANNVQIDDVAINVKESTLPCTNKSNLLLLDNASPTEGDNTIQYLQLTATNNSNASGLDFETLSYTMVCRIAARFKFPEFEYEGENFRNSAGIWSLVNGQRKVIETLQIGSYPKYFHYALSAMCQLDNFQVDGVQYIFDIDGNYDPSPSLGGLDIDMATAELPLLPVAQNVSNHLC